MRRWVAALVAACAAAVSFPSVRPKPTKTVLRSKQPVAQKPDDYARDIYQAIKRDDWPSALQAYQHARRARARLPTNCYNGILNGLAKRADGVECERVFEDMRLLSVEPTEASRTALAKAHALNGDGDKALEALRGGSDWTPKLRTYAPVLTCLFSSGRVDDALRVWREMVSRSVRPSGELIVAAVAAIDDDHTLATFLGGLGDVCLNRKQLEAIQQRAGGVFMHVQNGKLGNLQLPGAGLTTTELASVRQGLFDAASQSSERDKNELEKFDGFLRDHPWRFTAVVDGPNVAYLNQNYDGGRFRPLQIKAVVDVLEARGHRVLVTLPAKYCEAVVPNHSKFATPLPSQEAEQALEEEEIALLEAWRMRGMLYAVPRACHDDLYWILGTTYNCLAVSNDRARDHWTGVFDSEAQYRRWSRAAVASVAISPDGVELSSPPVHEHASFASISSEGASIAVAPEEDAGEWLRVDVVFKQNE